MSQTRSLIALILTIAALAGCGVTFAPQYVEPASGDAASLSFAKSDHFLVLPSIFEDAVECKGRNRLPAIPNDGQVTRKVHAGQQLSVALLRTPDYFSEACTSIVTFTPESGHRYTARMSGHRSACHIELVDEGTLNHPSVDPQPVPHVDRKVLRPFVENGAFCTK
jgi:hypothetical protein